MKPIRTPRRTTHKTRPQTASSPLTGETTGFLPWLYFVSGVPALVYQTIWQRLLVLHSGVGASSIAIIVAAYLFGMGMGSLGGAWLSRRLSPRHALIAFAVVELTIGCYAILSPRILYDFLYGQMGRLYSHDGASMMLHCCALLLPTALMGSTLPLMTRALVRSALSNATSVTRLYALNTLGAALGASLAPWILMPYMGIVGAVSVGAALNFSIAVAALLLRARIVETDWRPSSGPQHHAKSSPLSASFRVWAALYFFSGGCAIGLEIVWFRILDVAIKSTSFTFGTVLSIYLLCLALGSLAGARLVTRLRDPLGAFLLLQCAVMATASMPIICLMHWPASLAPLTWLMDYWSRSAPFFPSFAEISQSSALYFFLPLGLIGMATFCMGFSFSVLQLGIACDARTTSVRVGWLQAANIAGCTLGSLVFGLVLLDAVGTAAALRILVACGVAFAFVGVLIAHRRLVLLFAGVGVATCLPWLPNSSQLWSRLHGHTYGSVMEVAEDATGVVALAPEPDGSIWRLSANGKGQSRLPYGGVHSKLGALPVTLHPDPRSIAIIGLGSGNTAWAASCRSSIQEVRVYEILTSEQRVLELDHLRGKWHQLDQLLLDSRVTISDQDGRHALMISDRQFDVIEADAIRPNGAYAGYLYSIEFFQLCSRRLRSGGLVCTWSPTPSTYTTFCKAFPHVLELDGGSTLIGSNSAIDFDPVRWRKTIESTHVSSYLGGEVVADCLGCIDRAVPIRITADESWMNTDLFPFDEFRPFE